MCVCTGVYVCVLSVCLVYMHSVCICMVCVAYVCVCMFGVCACAYMCHVHMGNLNMNAQISKKN